MSLSELLATDVERHPFPPICRLLLTNPASAPGMGGSLPSLRI